MTEKDTQTKMDYIAVDGILKPRLEKLRGKIRWLTPRTAAGIPIELDAKETIEKTLQGLGSWEVVGRGNPYMLSAETESGQVIATVDLFSREIILLRVDENGNFVSGLKTPAEEERNSSDYKLLITTYENGNWGVVEVIGRDSRYL